MPRSQRVRLAIDRAVAVIELSAPSRGNRIDATLAAEFRSAVDSAGSDDAVRVVLITAQGRDFCVGGAHLADVPFDEVRVAAALASLAMPVVVAVQGRAFDQGLELVLAADIRVAAHDARFALRQVVKGGVPFDGGTQRLPRAVGASLAHDMLLTGREINADEALAAGLVARLFESEKVEAEAREIARGIAGRGAAAARFAKEGILRGTEMPLEYGMRLEADLSILLHHDPERVKAIRAWRSRGQRRAEFQK